ncbi:MAG: cupredoxin domain-containing protein [bacterium]|nr:cupredoxin domain-containing protein [bacterium]
MNRKELILIFLVVVIIAFGWIMYGKNISSNPQGAILQQEQKSATLATAQAGGFFIDKTYVVIVTYADNGFSPSEITIPKGSAIIFRNYSSKKMRVASNPHPGHSGYPATGGCIGSTFDSCDNIPPKVSWSFVFDSSGTWGYHDHLNPSQNGTVTVQ